MALFVLSAPIHTAAFSDLSLLLRVIAFMVLGQISQKNMDVLLTSPTYTSWSPVDLWLCPIHHIVHPHLLGGGGSGSYERPPQVLSVKGEERVKSTLGH